MKILECRKQGIFNIGFIDPYIIHEMVVTDFADETEDNLLMFFKEKNTKTDILFPYNFQWVLISSTTNSILLTRC